MAAAQPNRREPNALGNHVEEVANRDEVTDRQRLALFDQELEHHPQRRALAL